jgi:hypothetical protein
MRLKYSELAKLKIELEEDSKHTSQILQDNNCRPISNISALNDYPHLLELNNETTSRISLEN